MPNFLQYLPFLLFFSTSVSIGQPSYQFDFSFPLKSSVQKSLAWAGGLNSPQINNFDLDGDGIDDLILYDRDNNQLKTFIWREDHYEFSPESALPFPTDISGWLLIRDFNQDGRPDIFTKQLFGISVYENTSSGGNLSFELVADPLISLSSGIFQNLQCSSTDIPVIQDIDADGDLDILVYNFAVGGFVRQHENFSMDRTGVAGLDFELVSKNWGTFEECDCQHYAFNGEGCGQAPLKIEHVGGKSLTLVDLNNDGLLDLLAGHEQCPELYFLPNTGTPEQALFESFEAPFKGINFPFYPTAYQVKLYGSEKPSIIASSNILDDETLDIDFQNTVWLLETSNGDLELTSTNFLQGEMLDFGSHASAVAMDWDQDGLKDLIVAAQHPSQNAKSAAQLFWLKNTGSNTAPQFEMQSNPPIDLSMLNRTFPQLQVFDYDGNGQEDLLINVHSEDQRRKELYWVKSGGSLSDLNPISIEFPTNQHIRASDNFYFYRKEGKVNLVIARTEGRLELWEVNQNQAILINKSFLGIEDDFTKAKPDICIFNYEDDFTLIKTDLSGNISWIQNIHQEPQFYPHLWSTNETSTAFRLGEGNHLNPVFWETHAMPYLLLGQKSGGLLWLKPGTENQQAWEVNCYPNPVNKGSEITIYSNQNAEVHLYNMAGQALIPAFKIFAFQEENYPIKLQEGLYLLSFKSERGIITKKIVVD
ncbi:T9SS type A sorting domain-containing protein [Persicobacter diffluens]|uniref:Secretion system C-terminal sorting domain-containing protein n=1 Tax=Persicobacter diffluens TaxID=981 RepID=A0AAN4VVI9_9BACT|nr:hypothetical protein PEDI_07390 [Persicobacter diffluens]